MVQETLTPSPQLSPVERANTATGLMELLSSRLARHRAFRTVLARAVLSPIPGYAASLGTEPIIFRSRGQLCTFENRVGPHTRRLELERYKNKTGSEELELTENVVLTTFRGSEGRDGLVHYHKEFQEAEEPESLDNSTEAIIAIRRLISQL